MSKNSAKIEYIFLCRAIEVFNQDLSRLHELLKTLDKNELSKISKLLEATTENIEYTSQELANRLETK